MATITLLPAESAVAGARADVAASVAAARLVDHFVSHQGWMEEGQLTRDAAKRLVEVPSVIVQGRFDVRTSGQTAWDLHRAWPAAELQIVSDAGHAGSEPGIVDAFVRATDRFAKPSTVQEASPRHG